MLREGEVAFPRDGPPSVVIQYQVVSPEIIHIQVTLSGLSKLCLYTYTHVGVSNNNSSVRNPPVSASPLLKLQLCLPHLLCGSQEHRLSSPDLGDSTLLAELASHAGINNTSICQWNQPMPFSQSIMF